jgi:hypothetical protein
LTSAPSFILSIRHSPVGGRGGVGKKASDFLRYVQYRDHHLADATVKDVDGMLRYVSHRDQASSRGRLFDDSGTVGDEERRELTDLIRRSIKDLTPWPGRGPDPRRAMYQLVLSPREADGLDLRRLTRAAMHQLGRDAGAGGLPPWVAAEHRNTAHRHVHIVMAARREVSPGQFRTLQVNRPRLARMKEAVGLELGLQRDHGTETAVDLRHRLSRSAVGLARDRQREHGPDRQSWLQERGNQEVGALLEMFGRRHPGPSMTRTVGQMAGRMAKRYIREAQREARERGYGSRSDEEEEQSLRRSQSHRRRM